MKKVIILSTSLHKNSNSDALARAFEKGAREAGNEVEYVSLVGKTVGACIGCLTCQRTQKCVLRDDAADIAARIGNADVVAFATPVYYYTVCGQMKTLLDRCNPLFSSAYRFRDVYLLATAADNAERAMDTPVRELQGWLDCFEKARLAGVLRGVGLTNGGEAAAQPELLRNAYEMGKGV